MQVETLERWIRQRLRRDANLCVVLSPVAILGGLLVLFLTFWLAYAVSFMVAKVFAAIPALLFDVRWKLGHTGRLWAAAGFMVVLIVSFLRSDRRFPTSYGDFEGDPINLGLALSRHDGTSRASLALMLHPGTSARMIVDLLNIGPRLVWGGFALLRESAGSRSADTVAAARLAWTLVTSPGRVTYEALGSIYDRRELNAAFRALKAIPGVVFLEQGVTLTQELRAEWATLEP